MKLPHGPRRLRVSVSAKAVRPRPPNSSGALGAAATSALIFPSGALSVQYACDPDLARTVTSSYSDWISDYVSDYRQRLFFAAPLTLPR